MEDQAVYYCEKCGRKLCFCWPGKERHLGKYICPTDKCGHSGIVHQGIVIARQDEKRKANLFYRMFHRCRKLCEMCGEEIIK